MAHVDCKGLASHDPFLHAACHHRLEQLAQKIAPAKPAVAVLGERRMIGDVAVEPQATEPAIGKIEVDLVAQPTLRTDAEAVADDEDPDYQLRIDRGSSHVAIVRPQMRPQSREIDKTVDLAKQVIVGDMPLKAEAIEQRLLHHSPLAHHRRTSCTKEKGISAPHRDQGVFQQNRRKADIADRSRGRLQFGQIDGWGLSPFDG
jgi:hypothetical protein